MNATAKIFKYELRDVVRSRWIVAYALFFLLITESLLRFGGGPQALLSLMNVAFIIIPLVSIVFGTMYLYNARDFIELMLAQPIDRRHMFGGLFLGLAIPLSLGLIIGVVTPFALRSELVMTEGGTLSMLLLTGIFLTFIFVALAFLIVMVMDEKVKGLAIALLVWLTCGILYDGLVLFLVNMFAAYPLETPTLVLTILNPVDLARVLLLLQFDIAALMGYTGAVFESFFGSTLGLVIALGSLILWVAAPLYISMRFFMRKDF